MPLLLGQGVGGGYPLEIGSRLAIGDANSYGANFQLDNLGLGLNNGKPFMCKLLSERVIILIAATVNRNGIADR